MCWLPVVSRMHACLRLPRSVLRQPRRPDGSRRRCGDPSEQGHGVEGPRVRGLHLCLEPSQWSAGIRVSGPPLSPVTPVVSYSLHRKQTSGHSVFQSVLFCLAYLKTKSARNVFQLLRLHCFLVRLYRLLINRSPVFSINDVICSMSEGKLSTSQRWEEDSVFCPDFVQKCYTLCYYDYYCYQCCCCYCYMIMIFLLNNWL